MYWNLNQISCMYSVYRQWKQYNECARFNRLFLEQALPASLLIKTYFLKYCARSGPPQLGVVLVFYHIFFGCDWIIRAQIHDVCRLQNIMKQVKYTGTSSKGSNGLKATFSTEWSSWMSTKEYGSMWTQKKRDTFFMIWKKICQ